MADLNQRSAPATTASSSDSPALDAPGAPAVAQPVATATRPRPRPAPPRCDKLPPWRILLHNDDVNEVGYVVETIIELLKTDPRTALIHTLTAHRKGLALLGTTHREKAELLADQFQSRRLSVSIEPEN